MKIAELLLSELSSLHLIIVAILLPLNYFRDCVDVHREYAKFFRDVTKEWGSQWNLKVTNSMLSSFIDVLYVFEIEWWYMISMCIFMILIFLVGSALSDSTMLLTDSDKKVAEIMVFGTGVSFGLYIIYRVKLCKRAAHQLMKDHGLQVLLATRAHKENTA
jgi:prepilin signal peptidase PulO-like enzyme (type II secretory pathway)